jgi:hypothetical protein
VLATVHATPAVRIDDHGIQSFHHCPSGAALMERIHGLVR